MKRFDGHKPRHMAKRNLHVPEWLWQGLLLWVIGKMLDMSLATALTQLSALM